MFLQQVASKKHAENAIDNSQRCKRSSNDESSVIIEGPWATEIHKENLKRLNEMSQEEILKEKSKLEITLKPELIQFLKDRRNKKQKVMKNEASTSSKDRS